MTTKKAFALGCGGILLSCIAICLIIWFIQVPRLSGDFEAKMVDGVATLIVEDIDSTYSHDELQDGQNVRIPFSSLNRYISNSTEDQDIYIEIASNSEAVTIHGVGSENSINLDLEVAFVPEATEDGRLRLRPMEGESWFQKRMIEIIGGGLETAINDWLERNNLVLTDVTLIPGAMILTVEGE